MVPKPGKKSDEATESIFPEVNSIFGLCSAAVEMFLSKIGCFEKKGDVLTMSHNRFKKLRDRVSDRSKVEKSIVRIRKKKATTFLKLENIDTLTLVILKK